MRNYLKVFTTDDKDIYVNLDNVVYFGKVKDLTEVRYMTYKLAVGYTELTVEQIMKKSQTERVIQ